MRKSLGLFTLAIVIAAFCSLLAAGAMAADVPAASGVVNINSASVTELMLLPRVGEKAAQRIIDYRTAHPFKTSADLLEVKGFGTKTYELVAPYIAVDGKTTLTAKVKSPRKPRTNQPTTTASH